MKKKRMVDILGMKLKTIIEKHHYPTLEESILSNQQCEEFRSQLPGAPVQNDALRQQMMKRLLNGQVEEIQDYEQYLVFIVNIRYKSEIYVAELKLEDLKWSFLNLLYIGKQSRKNIFRIWQVATGAAILIAGTIALSPLSFSNHDQESSSASTQAMIQENVSINELKEIAEDKQYVLLTQEEMETALEEHAEQNLEEQLNKRLQEELEAREKEKADKEESEDEDHSEEERPENIDITIEEGMSSHDIAQLLVEEGLARNAREVRELFTELDVHQKVRYGTFEIPSDATYLEIIDVLTG